MKKTIILSLLCAFISQSIHAADALAKVACEQREQEEAEQIKKEIVEYARRTASLCLCLPEKTEYWVRKALTDEERAELRRAWAQVQTVLGGPGSQSSSADSTPCETPRQHSAEK